LISLLTDYFGNEESFTLTASSSLYTCTAGLVTAALSSWMVVYGTRMYRTLSCSQSNSLSPDVRAERMYYIRRALWLSLGLAVCYFVRGVNVTLVMISRHTTTNITSNFTIYMWFVMGLFVPFIVPVRVQIDICRKSYHLNY
jgi:hypothetical protein